MEAEARRPEAAPALLPAEVLELVPQRPPFRYLDELFEVDEHHAIGRYTFRAEEWFYAGHFPGEPVTPGVILLESMAQTGLVALGLYLMSLELPRSELAQWRTFFTDGSLELCQPVLPGERVTSHATRVFWRKHKLRSKVEMTRADGTLVARSEIAGMGVRRG